MKITLEITEAEVNGIVSYLADTVYTNNEIITDFDVRNEIKRRLYDALHDEREDLYEYIKATEKDAILDAYDNK